MWIYKITTGQLIDPDGNIAGTGYSGGNCGRNPEGRNNPDMQDKHQIGPICEGDYTIGPAYTNPHTGPLSMDLIPDALNEMYGRSGFEMHGDNLTHTASEGCIIQIHAVRLLVSQSPDRKLRVTK